MAKTFLTSINLNNNELQNALLHPLAAAPGTPGAGQIYYNTGSNILFLYNGTAWVDITTAIASITTATPAVTIDITDPINPIINIADADATNSGLLTSAFFTDLTNATNLATAGTIAKRDASGNIQVGTTPVNAGDATSKAYVDAQVALGSGTVNVFQALLGDGVALSYVVTHSLGNQFCHTQLFDAVSNAEVITDVEITDANTVTVNFNIAPTTDQYRIVIQG